MLRALTKRLPSLAELGARRVRPPGDLGSIPLDRVPLANAPQLAHLAAALASPAAGRLTSTDLLSGRAGDFARGPDPSALFERERRAHAALGPARPDAPKLRVLSYNLALLDRAYGWRSRVTMPKLGPRREALPERLLGPRRYDALLLQELWEEEDIARLRDCAARHGYAVWPGTKARRGQHGTAIVVREALLGGGEIREEGQLQAQYPLEYWPGPKIRRGWLAWRFVHPGLNAPVRLLTTHLTPFPEFWRHRALQARQLGRVVAAAPDDELVVLGGDLNAGPRYPSDKLKTSSGKVIAGWWVNAMSYPIIRHYGDLQDAVVLGTEPGDHFTATDQNSLHAHSYAGMEHPSRMDHLLVRDHAVWFGCGRPGSSSKRRWTSAPRAGSSSPTTTGWRPASPLP